MQTYERYLKTMKAYNFVPTKRPLWESWQHLVVMNKLYLSLPIAPHRPEEIQVIETPKMFVVQSRRPGQSAWIVLSERMELEDAILDAVNWYPRRP